MTGPNRNLLCVYGFVFGGVWVLLFDWKWWFVWAVVGLVTALCSMLHETT